MTTISSSVWISALTERLRDAFSWPLSVVPQALAGTDTSLREPEADKLPEMDETAYWAWTAYGYW
ncbi:hypothetical protein QBK99_12570 [Corticibacterium sp. UT-5YL-CI-8]|nr:hypothetical protein [Tianweitania sp. UT-5YL-CI-8]